MLRAESLWLNAQSLSNDKHSQKIGNRRASGNVANLRRRAQLIVADQKRRSAAVAHFHLTKDSGRLFAFWTVYTVVSLWRGARRTLALLITRLVRWRWRSPIARTFFARIAHCIKTFFCQSRVAILFAFKKNSRFCTPSSKFIGSNLDNCRLEALEARIALPVRRCSRVKCAFALFPKTIVRRWRSFESIVCHTLFGFANAVA